MFMFGRLCFYMITLTALRSLRSLRSFGYRKSSSTEYSSVLPSSVVSATCNV